MQTVNQAIEIVSYVTGTSRGRANQFARALLDAGLLPKSSGRDIKKITAAQFLPLVAAVALAEKVADAAAVARAFADLPAQVEDAPYEGDQTLPHFFARAMKPDGGWTRVQIEFAKTAAGFTAVLDFTIKSKGVEMSLQLPFYTDKSWGHFCKSSFTISAEGVEVMRNLFAREDIEGMSFTLSGHVTAK